MIILLKLLAFVALSGSGISEAGTDKCVSSRVPKPKSGSCVGIENCLHDQSKEDTANLNSEIRQIAKCVVKHSGKSMKMVSGFRCSRGAPGCPNGKDLPYNGGADCSQHLVGNAIDFHMKGLSLEEIQSYAFACGAKRATKYPCYNFVHMDTKSGNKTWPTCNRGSPDSVSRIKTIIEKVGKRRS
jgi:hypothetical protein